MTETKTGRCCICGKPVKPQFVLCYGCKFIHQMDGRKPDAQTMEQFVVSYLKEHGETSVVDAAFHEEFHRRYGGELVASGFGAMASRRAMYVVRALTRSGRLVTEYGVPKTGVPHWAVVFTRVLVYKLAKEQPHG